MNKPAGLTWLEVVIVMVVLTVVASAIVPQFSQAAIEAKISSLCRNLQKVRRAIDIYKAHHNGQLPGEGDCDIIKALTSVTDAQGNFVPDKQGNGVEYFGPYITRFPRNSYNGLATVDLEGRPGDDSHGWYLDMQTGRFCADNTLQHSEL